MCKLYVVHKKMKEETEEIIGVFPNLDSAKRMADEKSKKIFEIIKAKNDTYDDGISAKIRTIERKDPYGGHIIETTIACIYDDLEEDFYNGKYSRYHMSLYEWGVIWIEEKSIEKACKKMCHLLYIVKKGGLI